MAIYKCVVCEKSFDHRYRWGGIKTCSKECRYISTGLTGTRKVLRICLRCNKAFGIPPAWLSKAGNRGLYCSRKCRFDVWEGRSNKEFAQNEVTKAIVKGLLIPKMCEVCGSERTDAHHFKGYEKENIFAIKWLCRAHHRKAHFG